MTFCFSRVTCLTAIALILTAAGSLSAQIKYASGQSVVPVFEGWERTADGGFNMVFGYMNRNYEEEVEIPIGPNNKIEPGDGDQGQPAQFYTRRQEFVFKVKVSKDWGDKDLVWTLVSGGKIEKAYGSLLPIWELGNLVYLENRRGTGALTYPEEPNNPPSIEMVGPARRTAAVGKPITLSVEVTDDGYPTPRARPRRTAGFARAGERDVAANGPKLQSPITQAVVKLDPDVRLGVTWVLYRGAPGTVTFEPMRVPVVSTAPGDRPAGPGPLAGNATTKVTFGQPGTYRLRAYADDGVLVTPLDVTVTVQPGAER